MLNGFALREIPVPASRELSSIHRVPEGVPDRSTMDSRTTCSDDANYYGDPRVSWLQLIGRRKPGMSDSEVRAELGVLGAQIDRQQPDRRSTIFLGRATAFSMPRAGCLVLVYCCRAPSTRTAS